MIRKTLGTIFSVLFLLNFAFASDIPTYDIGKKNIQLKDFTIGLIIDKSHEMTINQIAQIKEVKLTNSRFIIKSIDDNYWFIFNIENSSSETIKRIIGFDEVYMETADIYYQTVDGWHHEKNGLSQPMEQREIKNRCPIFYVSLKAGETKTIYLKLHSKFALILGVFLDDIPEFANAEQTKIMGYWSYFGAAMALLLYNIFLLYHVRERVYVYYVIYASCIIIFTFLYSGYSLYVNSNVHLHYSLHASIAIMGVFVTLFTLELLKPQNVNNWIGKVLNIIIGIYVLLALLIAIDIYFYQFLVLFGMPSMLFLLFTGIYSLIKKTPIARYYVVAMSGYLIGLFMIAAVNLGLIPFNDITRYGFLIGSLIELSVFSLALGYRIKLLQEEKFVYQNKILSQEISMKQNLETKVGERTEELIKISEELDTTNKELRVQIKEKDKAFDALKKSDIELQESNNSKDKFFSIIAHDLKSPFNSILGFMGILKNQYSEYGEEEKIKMIDMVYKSAHRTYSLLENLLIWSRTQTNNVKYFPQKIDVITILNENIQLSENFAKNKNIKLNLNIEKPLEIYGDVEMTNVILRNLISNAIKFTNKGGVVTISADYYGQNSENKIKISVKDTGVGINKENIERLFLISHNISTPGTNNEKGTGLGLILCKEFVKIHQGKIWVESEVGKGSVFHFTLPAK